MAAKKILEMILRGPSDTNISFDELRGVLKNLGFSERIRGSHHIFNRKNVDEILNLQANPMPKFEIIIYWSTEDEAFIAEAPELPGCAADGKTYREALANVEGVIKEWIETATELGRPIPLPKGRLVFA